MNQAFNAQLQAIIQAQHEQAIAGLMVIFFLIALFAIPLWMIAIKLWNWPVHQVRPKGGRPPEAHEPT